MSVRSMTMHAESIRLASEGLTWLEHLFLCIANAPDAGLHAKRLAEIGRYLASDAADSADCAYAEMRSDIEKGGAR